MKYTILVSGPPYGTQNSSTAFLFSHAIIASKNELLSVFFYCDGALNANKLASFPPDECNLFKKWTSLCCTHSVKLNVCVSAARRRGVIDTKIDNKFSTRLDDSKSSFCFSGLSELVKYIEVSDRVMQF
ncbi:sulfurtransferase [Buchnera aphidicola (Schlechtendalia chinensis)]|uniref:Sulfurtransferase n=1 Tax=Buchnera aphidicola subsp. Schlechtendalia chinensis TaxID=118110 RepID=A0A172WE35_BUCSC|nr:sulfurtransferase complex subunit TusD [Buchnera aphidicola]ANF17233.1 sulfurtransferase [Buchnera aphidicola (Schlechtendalia chinensis)]